jgi:hypothetical protein
MTIPSHWVLFVIKYLLFGAKMHVICDKISFYFFFVTNDKHFTTNDTSYDTKEFSCSKLGFYLDGRQFI